MSREATFLRGYRCQCGYYVIPALLGFYVPSFQICEDCGGRLSERVFRCVKKRAPWLKPWTWFRPRYECFVVHEPKERVLDSAKQGACLTKIQGG